jgi:hypothetical protein
VQVKEVKVETVLITVPWARCLIVSQLRKVKRDFPPVTAQLKTRYHPSITWNFGETKPLEKSSTKDNGIRKKFQRVIQRNKLPPFQTL